MISRLEARTLVLLAASLAPLSAAASTDPVALRWLAQSCSAGDRVDPDAVLRAEGRAAERTLVKAFTKGPSRSEGDKISNEAGRQFDEVNAALTAERTYGLSAGNLASVRAISREQFVARARERFERAYRDSALVGLGVLALPEGVALLRRVASGPESPERETAVMALERAGIPLRTP